MVINIYFANAHMITCILNMVIHTVNINPFILWLGTHADYPFYTALYFLIALVIYTRNALWWQNHRHKKFSIHIIMLQKYNLIQL